MTQLKIEPLHGALPERTYQHLRNLIIRGRIPAGGRVTESEIALRLGISRTPVREALAWLARDGYLVPGSKGLRTELVVAPLTAEEVHELWEIIGALESHAVTYAAGLPPAPRYQLVRALRRLNVDLLTEAKAQPRNYNRLLELQTAFHVEFVNPVAGPVFRGIYDRIRPHVQRYEWAYSTRADADYEPSSREHSRIIAAIRVGNPARARKAIETHWRLAAKRTVTIIDRLSEREESAEGNRSIRTGS